MTASDQAEYDYRKTERLGLLCGTKEPTPWQENIAHFEAMEAISKINATLSKTLPPVPAALSVPVDKPSADQDLDSQ